MKETQYPMEIQGFYKYPIAIWLTLTLIVFLKRIADDIYQRPKQEETCTIKQISQNLLDQKENLRLKNPAAVFSADD